MDREAKSWGKPQPTLIQEVPGKSDYEIGVRPILGMT
jgi:hypothetical protein